MSAVAELARYDHWVCWRQVIRKGRPTKVPYRPDGRLASTTEPTTWASHADVLAAAASFDGIGFVFCPDNPYTGVDIDKALRDGQLHPQVVELLDTLNSYCEWSPSETGVHVLLEATKPAGRSSTKKIAFADEFAVYDRGRFFTVTSNRLRAYPDRIEARQAELEAVHAVIFGGRNGATPERQNAPPRKVVDLLGAFPKLKAIHARACAAPQDDSGSGWDHYLACEAIRSGLTDREIAALLRDFIGRDDRDKDDRYIDRTLAAAHRSEPGDGNATERAVDPTQISDPCGYVSREWRLPDERRIVSGRSTGSGGAAIVYLELADGSTLRFKRLGDLFELRAHVREVSLVAQTRCPSLKQQDVTLLAQLVREICTVTVDPEEDLDELAGWLGGFLRLTERRDGELRAGEIWDTLELVRAGSDKLGKFAVVIEDTAGELWVPADAFMRHIRTTERGVIDWGTLDARMRDLGWERLRRQAKKEGDRIRLSFFVGVDDWGEDD